MAVRRRTYRRRVSAERLGRCDSHPSGVAPLPGYLQAGNGVESGMGIPGSGAILRVVGRRLSRFQGEEPLSRPSVEWDRREAVATCECRWGSMWPTCPTDRPGQKRSLATENHGPLD